MPKRSVERGTLGEIVSFYVRQFPGMSATEIANALGLSTASVSSYLTKQVRLGALFRRGGTGPRGGFTYYPPIPPKTLWERLSNEDL